MIERVKGRLSFNVPNFISEGTVSKSLMMSPCPSAETSIKPEIVVVRSFARPE